MNRPAQKLRARAYVSALALLLPARLPAACRPERSRSPGLATACSVRPYRPRRDPS